ncbi:10 kDa chaperonin [Pyrenophora tritici-repentis]|uniref:GroS, Co-chaperonin GroES (HSP10) n=3 Tax=Pyrenophora tritici-repentis TaxID=45151 RepID=A0A317AZ47_9PLEO|nr:10 kDa chaperonin [Pyrenophora tritici-repentis Pt-1C-BFP]KAA8625303.1 10 kDa chaperonin [Pyrenophora tritici-repentis]EDU40127.1 10 kDa chaperonin [Pyrenophora tritici-repentis Pt-1C-BFP]KAF7576791.1 GroS, Co-chaperonin GroES (HSP10) [Pyrenophora tritici-repentis]KAG9387462.1 10 kDa chaperonin [Pyrenophora tritici-repentis]KAI0571856.1 10 kDa chaperonin [Pyrenophora tritici-repentis]
MFRGRSPPQCARITEFSRSKEQPSIHLSPNPLKRQLYFLDLYKPALYSCDTPFLLYLGLVIPIQIAAMSAIKSIRSIAPLLDRILVQRIKPEAKTATGIFLPETAVKELNEAKVLAVGPGAIDKDGKRVAPSVQPGDKVLIPQYGGSPIKVGDEELSLFRDHELLAKINE